jgi:hypothetical protein
VRKRFSLIDWIQGVQHYIICYGIDAKGFDCFVCNVFYQPYAEVGSKFCLYSQFTLARSSLERPEVML